MKESEDCDLPLLGEVTGGVGLRSFFFSFGINWVRPAGFFDPVGALTARVFEALGVGAAGVTAGLGVEVLGAEVLGAEIVDGGFAEEGTGLWDSENIPEESEKGWLGPCPFFFFNRKQKEEIEGKPPKDEPNGG